ncbi:MAG: hypothetical protein ACTHMV_13490 [Chitinophagaceae bacterium]
MFILTPEAIEAIKADPILVANLRIELGGISETSIYRFYTKNNPNNDLTLYGALVVIMEETGMTIGQIVKPLEKSGTNVKRKRHSVQS